MLTYLPSDSDDEQDNEKKGLLVAYANNPSTSEDQYSQINFCKPFFAKRSLMNAIAYGTAYKNPILKSDMNKYENRGK